MFNGLVCVLLNAVPNPAGSDVKLEPSPTNEVAVTVVAVIVGASILFAVTIPVLFLPPWPNLTLPSLIRVAPVP